MKKIVFCLLLIFEIAIGSPNLVLAQGGFSSDAQKQTQAFAEGRGAKFETPRDPRLVVAYVIQALLGLLGLLFVCYTLYAGFLILTSRGEEEKITKGKETLKTAVIGVMIILSAYTITLFGAKIATGGRSVNDRIYAPPGDSGGTVYGDENENVEFQMNEDPNKFLTEDPAQ